MESNKTLLEERIDFINDKRALHIHAANALYIGNFMSEKQLTSMINDINNYYDDQINAGRKMAQQTNH